MTDSPLPLPRRDVPRELVYLFVRAVLLDERVGDVRCEAQGDGRYTVRAMPR